METGILTALMTRILAALTGGQTELLGLATSVATSLALIELVWAALMWSFGSGDEAMKGFFSKVVKLGIWSLLIFNFPEIVEGIRQFFVHVGLTAAGGGGLPVAVTDPSAIAEMGFAAIKPIWVDFQEQDSTLMVGFSIKALVAILVLTACGIFILLLYYFIAISMFLTVVEFYIVSSLGLVFVPWGINNHTKWIAERYFGALVALGTKLSVQVFMASVTLPVLEQFKLGPEPSFAQTFTLMLGVLAVAMLNWRAPNIAAGMMSGSAALSTSDVTTPVANAAGMAASAAGMVAAGPAGAAAGGMAASAAPGAARAIEKATSVSSGGGSSGASSAGGGASGGLAEAVSAAASTSAGVLGAAAGVSDSASAAVSSPSSESSSQAAPSSPGSSTLSGGGGSGSGGEAQAASGSTSQAGGASSSATASHQPASAPGGVLVPMSSGTRVDVPAVQSPSPSVASAPSDNTPGQVVDPGPLPNPKRDK